MKRIFTLSISLMFCVLLTKGQDIHFSQFYASPLTLNPALTGKTPCTYRFSAIYRNQWSSVVGPSSYQTYSVAFDAGILKGKLNDNIVGVGLMMFNDKSGDGSLTNMSAMASVAYHQKLASDDHYLSIGFQAGYVQKKVDESKLIFENMIDGNGGVTQPSGETFIDEKFNYFDFNAGFHWSSTFTDRFHAYAGFGYFHIGEPVETFLGDQSNVLNARYMAHGGVKVGFSDKIVLLPAVQWQMQGEGSVSELMAGASLGFALGDDSNFYLGGYFRNHKDAVILSTGIDFKNLQLGLSYDINISDLSVASNSKGGPEISLSYFGCIAEKEKSRIIDCPRF